MTQIYIDENDVVQFDRTSDSRYARRANINRGFMKMADNLEELAHLTMTIRRRRGLSVDSQIDALAELKRDKAMIRAAAGRR